MSVNTIWNYTNVLDHSHCFTKLTRTISLYLNHDRITHSPWWLTNWYKWIPPPMTMTNLLHQNSTKPLTPPSTTTKPFRVEDFKLTIPAIKFHALEKYIVSILVFPILLLLVSIPNLPVPLSHRLIRSLMQILHGEIQF